MAHTLQKFTKEISYCINNSFELSYNCLLTEDFIENNLDKIDWHYVLLRQKLSENFLRKHLNTIINSSKTTTFNCFYTMVAWQRLSEDFLEELIVYPEFKNNCFVTISYRQKLSEAFMTKYKDKLCWDGLCLKQKMSESFLNNHINHLNMKIVSRHQKLSPEFLAHHLDKLDIALLLKNKKLSSEAKKVLIDNGSKIVASLLGA